MIQGEAKRFCLDHVDGAPTYKDAKIQLISLLLKVPSNSSPAKKKIDDLANLTPEYCRTEKAVMRC
jgi:hypothetical protein